MKNKKLSESRKKLFAEGKIKTFWIKGKSRGYLFGKKISATRRLLFLDNKLSPPVKKGQTWDEVYGKDRANEIRKKSSLSNMGKKWTEEKRLKIKESWKNKTYEDIEKWKKKLSESKKKKYLEGKNIPWIKGKRGLKSMKKGKTYEELYGKERANDIKKQISFMLNKKEIKDKISRLKKGKISHFKGKTYKEIYGEERSKIIINKMIKSKKGRKPSEEELIRLKKLRENQILPLEDTIIEKKIQKFLKELKIGFFTHQYITEIKNSYKCDIFIPVQKNKCIFIQQPIIIECDGNYWHGNPILYSTNILNQKQIDQKQRDEIRTKELIKRGYRVIRLWENDIKKMDINQFKEKVYCH